jgi:hypothetical protein
MSDAACAGPVCAWHPRCNKCDDDKWLDLVSVSAVEREGPASEMGSPGTPAGTLPKPGTLRTMLFLNAVSKVTSSGHGLDGGGYCNESIMLLHLFGGCARGHNSWSALLRGSHKHTVFCPPGAAVTVYVKYVALTPVPLGKKCDWPPNSFSLLTGAHGLFSVPCKDQPGPECCGPCDV